MKKSNNRGVSLIEILIAVVVFVICVTPIINQLVAGIRLGQKADDQQAANDYGKSVSETVKQVDLDRVVDLKKAYVDKAALAKMLELDTTNASTLSVSCDFFSFDKSCIKTDGDGNYIYELDNTKVNALTKKIASGSHVKVVDTSKSNMTVGSGTEYGSVTDIYKALDAINATLDADKQQALVRQYTIKCKTELNARDYDVVLVLDNVPYAINSLTNAGYVDPNKVNLGNLSSLDASTTAVILSASNYDSVASASYMASVLAQLEQKDNITKATQLRNNTKNALAEFTTEDRRPDKKITITIKKGSGDYPYTVACKVEYQDTYLKANYGIPDSEAHLEYMAYEQSFAEMPDIYLMYNQYIYIDNYGSDNIYVDNQVSGEKAKLYVVRTSEKDDNGASIIKEGSAARDKMDGSEYKYRTIFYIVKSTSSNPLEIYTNVVDAKSNINNNANNTTKIGVSTVAGDDYSKIVRLLSDDERYSDAGRAYNVYIELTNNQSNNITTYSTSKGDY